MTYHVLGISAQMFLRSARVGIIAEAQRHTNLTFTVCKKLSRKVDTPPHTQLFYINATLSIPLFVLLCIAPIFPIQRILSLFSSLFSRLTLLSRPKSLGVTIGRLNPLVTRPGIQSHLRPLPTQRLLLPNPARRITVLNHDWYRSS